MKMEDKQAIKMSILFFAVFSMAMGSMPVQVSAVNYSAWAQQESRNAFNNEYNW